MSKASRTEKQSKMLALLSASQKKKIAKSLAAHGFTAEELARGWALFKNSVGTSFATPAPETPETNELRPLDVWENKWFPIVSATLEANFPDVHARVFLNLTQTEGAWLIPSVEILLERLVALEAEEASPEDKAARELLVQRGLTSEVIAEGIALVNSLKTLDSADETDEDEDDAKAKTKAAKQAADDAMWNYYKEWSAIIRVAITSKKLLRSLGFLKEGSNKKAKETKESKDTKSTN